MKLTTAFAIGLTLVAGSPALAEDYTVGGLKIESPWTRATPAGAGVAGGFMKIENKGIEPDRLIGGSATVAGKFEVHEMAMIDNIMKMRELEKGLELKPGHSVELKPGSYHVMFMALKEQLKEGDKVKGTLVFEKAGKVDVEYTVKPMGSMDSGMPKH